MKIIVIERRVALQLVQAMEVGKEWDQQTIK